MKEIEKIIDLLEEISFSCPTDDREYSKFDTLRMLTKKVWSRHHAELIMELEKNNKAIVDVDYQIFWYECLGFPPIVPLLRDYHGNTLGTYGYLQSDFNESCGFGDSTVTMISLEERNKLQIHIELDSWETAKRGILSFTNTSKYDIRKINQRTGKIEDIVVDLADIKNLRIDTVDEIPPIKYFLNSYEIEDIDSIKGKRMFYLSGSERCKYDWKLIIFSDGWNLVTS